MVDEASRQYQIPLSVFQEYERLGLCDGKRDQNGLWECDDRDLDVLGLIITLHESGFNDQEVQRYMEMVLGGEKTETARLQMLNWKRKKTLDEIHLRESQVDRLDYLRYELQNKREQENGKIKVLGS